jgi:hypothetical protein
MKKELDFRELKARAKDNIDDKLYDLYQKNFSDNDELNEFILKTKATIIIHKEVERILLTLIS